MKPLFYVFYNCVDMRFLLLFMICFATSFSIAQITSIDSNYKENKVHPSMLLKHSLGLNIKEYLGLGLSYRYRTKGGLGVQVSYSPKINFTSTNHAVEVAGLYTLFAGTTDRYWFKGKKDYNFYLYQSNIWSFSDDVTRNSHSINVGFEEIYWRKLSGNVSLGYIITPKTDFRLSVSFGTYYRF